MCNLTNSTITQVTKTLPQSYSSIQHYALFASSSADSFGTGSSNNITLRAYGVYKVSSSQVKFTVYPETNYIRMAYTIGY